MRKGYVVLATVAAVIGASASSANAGTTYLPHHIAVETNNRYGHDCFWAPPKGTDYGDLPGALPIQKPNLYPDVGSTYFVAQYLLPAGASLTLQGKYPHERYMSYTMFKPVGGGQIGPGDHLRDEDIAPDPGSTNPFVSPHRRDVKKRNYTLHIVSGDVPADRAPNTVYTGTTDPDVRIGMSMRNYLPDKGLDGTGGVGLPTLTLNLADGSTLQGQAACDMLAPTEDKSTSTFPQDAWKSLVAGSPDPANAPATNPPTWERFWNATFSVAGIFIDDPTTRAQTYPPTDVGGFQSNPDTRYMTTYADLNFGSVMTVSAKLPRTAATLPGAKRWPSNYDLRYWSLCTGSSPVTGLGYDCVYDQQVPLDKHRRYTLVVSRPADKPKNAKPKCGYRWLDFGDGESYPDPASRDYMDVLYMRFMAPEPDFTRAPQNVQTPGTEAAVMGPYFPHSAYTSTKAFEKRGCK
jgi:hypothetical protein